MWVRFNLSYGNRILIDLACHADTEQEVAMITAESLRRASKAIERGLVPVSDALPRDGGLWPDAAVPFHGELRVTRTDWPRV